MVSSLDMLQMGRTEKAVSELISIAVHSLFNLPNRNINWNTLRG